MIICFRSRWFFFMDRSADSKSNPFIVVLMFPCHLYIFKQNFRLYMDKRCLKYLYKKKNPFQWYTSISFQIFFFFMSDTFWLTILYCEFPSPLFLSKKWNYWRGGNTDLRMIFRHKQIIYIQFTLHFHPRHPLKSWNLYDILLQSSVG